ncbi:MAG: hypothetical protein GX020_09915 [Firmicutes bacterium]|jgi:polyhydroxyalkanoate synthesis regulator phasin|nr:hypothetical protein [Bacillota bacterium]
MALFQELERVKLKIVSLCDSLVEKGKLTEEELIKVVDILERLDEFDDESLKEALDELQRSYGSF